MSDYITDGRIVVGTDGSERADRAIDWAARRARDRGLTLLILLVMPEAPIPRRTSAAALVHEGEKYLEHVRERAGADLGRAVARTAEKYPEITIESAVAIGNAAEVLAKASKDADMVVVGARGKHAPVGVKLLGGVSDAVSAHAAGAVAVIPEESEEHPEGPVVVGVDSSRQARLAISRAFECASVRGVPLVALTAWDYGPYDAYNAEIWQFSIQEMNEQLTAEVEDVIAEDRERYPDVEVEIRALRGRASTELVEVSKQAGVVLIGSRGRGGFTGLLLGSTSRHVLREAHCPVIVVRGQAGWRSADSPKGGQN